MKQFKKLLITIIIFVVLFNNHSYALTQEEAGNTLAQFATNFFNEHGQETWYDYGPERERAYRGIISGDGRYHFDCVGWISFAVHQSLRMGSEAFTYFAVPPGRGNIPRYSNGFSLVKGSETNPNALLSQEEVEREIRPGDILFCGPGGPHVVLYAGNGKIVHSYSNLECEDIFKNDMKYTGYCAIGRITEEAASALNKNNVTTMFGTITGAADDFDSYYGTSEGHYGGSYTAGDWLFDKIIGFFDYILGIITYSIRMQFLGWTNMVEVLVNNFIDEISGANIEIQSNENEDNQNESDSADLEQSDGNDTTIEPPEGGYDKTLYEPTPQEKWDRINIEDLIYNHIPILDVNFFSFDKAAGEEIKEDSIIYTIRSNVAKWYFVIRNISIVLLVFVLIYLGIRVAIETAAQKRGRYKSMIAAWVTSFIIIFAIHLFMIFVININEKFVEIFENVNIKAVENLGATEEGSATIYNTIRTKAYSMKLSEGIPATIMYMVLVYYLIRFLYIYFKRYFIINILALMGPVMGIKYALDKIKSGKSSSSLPNWMFDFFINVFLQSIHAILYTVFMIMAFKAALDSIPGFVLALIMLNFLLKAEKMFIDIFRFESKGASLGDVRESKNYILDAYKTGLAVGAFGKSSARFFIGGGKFIGNFAIDSIQRPINMVRAIDNTVKNAKRTMQNKELVDYEPLDINKKVKDALNNVKYKIGDGLNDSLFDGQSLRLSKHKYKNKDPRLYNIIQRTLAANDTMIKKNFKRAVKTITGVAKVGVGIPMAIVDTKEGVTLLSSSISSLQQITKKKKTYGHRSKKEIISRRGRLAAAVATAGMSNVFMNEFDYIKDEMKKANKNNEKLNYLVSITKLEDDIEKELKIINMQKEIEKHGKTDEEKVEIDKKYDDSIKEDVNNALDSIITTKTITSVVKDYMYENDITKLTSKDVQEVLKRLENMAEDNEIKVKFGGRIKENVKQQMAAELHGRKMFSKIQNTPNINNAVNTNNVTNTNSKIDTNNTGNTNSKTNVNNAENTGSKTTANNTRNTNRRTDSNNAGNKKVRKNNTNATSKDAVDVKKAVNIIQEAIMQDGSVEIKKTNYDVLTQKIRELKSVTEKAKNNIGSSITDVNRFIYVAKKETSESNKPEKKRKVNNKPLKNNSKKK